MVYFNFYISKEQSNGVKPIVRYQHAFKNTYIYESFSPIDVNMFVYEIESTTSEIFYQYLLELSKHRPDEFNRHYSC